MGAVAACAADAAGACDCCAGGSSARRIGPLPTVHPLQPVAGDRRSLRSGTMGLGKRPHGGVQKIRFAETWLNLGPYSVRKSFGRFFLRQFFRIPDAVVRDSIYPAGVVEVKDLARTTAGPGCTQTLRLGEHTSDSSGVAWGGGPVLPDLQTAEIAAPTCAICPARQQFPRFGNR